MVSMKNTRLLPSADIYPRGYIFEPITGTPGGIFDGEENPLTQGGYPPPAPCNVVVRSDGEHTVVADPLRGRWRPHAEPLGQNGHPRGPSNRPVGPARRTP